MYNIFSTHGPDLYGTEPLSWVDEGRSHNVARLFGVSAVARYSKFRRIGLICRAFPFRIIHNFGFTLIESWFEVRRFEFHGRLITRPIRPMLITIWRLPLTIKILRAPFHYAPLLQILSEEPRPQLEHRVSPVAGGPSPRCRRLCPRIPHSQDREENNGHAWVTVYISHSIV